MRRRTADFLQGEALRISILAHTDIRKSSIVLDQKTRRGRERRRAGGLSGCKGDVVHTRWRFLLDSKAESVHLVPLTLSALYDHIMRRKMVVMAIIWLATLCYVSSIVHCEEQCVIMSGPIVLAAVKPRLLPLEHDLLACIY